MRICKLGIAVACAMILSSSPRASAQTKPPTAPPSGPNSNPAHDLSGVWFDDHPRLITVMQRYWAYTFTQEAPPMTPWAQALFDAAKPSFGPHAYPLEQTNDPIYHTCIPMGFPRIFLYPLPMQIVQTPGEVIMLFEYDSLRRQIFTDGRAHDTSLGPSWMGDSIGHWDGDTLIVDTENFNDKTWIDRVGHPHTDALHLVERIRRINHGHLLDDITIEDSKAYSKPWTVHLDFLLRPKWTLAEQFCEDIENFQDLEKKETSPGK
jgi:hypothetical protein